MFVCVCIFVYAYVYVIHIYICASCQELKIIRIKTLTHTQTWPDMVNFPKQMLQGEEYYFPCPPIGALMEHLAAEQKDRVRQHPLSMPTKVVFQQMCFKEVFF